jgi:uncharacterized protein YeaO (DUF488 family)
MQAKFINEKFSENSDPVQDLGIGGFIPSNIQQKISTEASEKWIKFLKNTLEGRIIKGTMMRWFDDTPHNWKEYTFRVKKVLNNAKRNSLWDAIEVQDQNGVTYSVISSEKIYVSE